MEPVLPHQRAAFMAGFNFVMEKSAQDASFLEALKRDLGALGTPRNLGALGGAALGGLGGYMWNPLEDRGMSTLAGMGLGGLGGYGAGRGYEHFFSGEASPGPKKPEVKKPVPEAKKLPPRGGISARVGKTELQGNTEANVRRLRDLFPQWPEEKLQRVARQQASEKGRSFSSGEFRGLKGALEEGKLRTDVRGGDQRAWELTVGKLRSLFPRWSEEKLQRTARRYVEERHHAISDQELAGLRKALDEGVSRSAERAKERALAEAKLRYGSERWNLPSPR